MRNAFEDVTAGLASGLMAEAQQKGTGAGMAAAFAGSAQPVLAQRQDRLQRDSERRVAGMNARDFVAMTDDVPASVRSGLEMLGYSGAIDDSDLAAMRGIRSNQPTSIGQIAAALDDGDPTGLEGVRFGAVNDQPAVSFTGPDGRTQVLTISEGQWLAGLRAREAGRRQSLQLAQQKAEHAGAVRRVQSAIDATSESSAFLGLPDVQQMLRSWAEESPTAVAEWMARYRAIEHADDREAQKFLLQTMEQKRGEARQRRVAASTELVRRQYEQAVQSIRQQSVAGSESGALAHELQAANTMFAKWLEVSAYQPGSTQAEMLGPLEEHGYDKATLFIEAAIAGAFPNGRPMQFAGAPSMIATASILQRVRQMWAAAGYSVPDPIFAEQAAVLTAALQERYAGASASVLGNGGGLTRDDSVVDPATSQVQTWQAEDGAARMSRAMEMEDHESKMADREQARMDRTTDSARQAMDSESSLVNRLAAQLRTLRTEAATKKGKEKDQLNARIDALVEQLMGLMENLVSTGDMDAG